MSTSANGLVWITGASTGIGRAVALELARRGRSVAASARSADKLASLAAEAEGGRIRPFPCDVTDPDACARTVASIEADQGPIETAILNAGTYTPDSADTFDLSVFRGMVDLNVLGTANCLAPLLPRWQERRRGHLAVVSSVAGYRGLPRSIGYGATKAALINMAEALKFDFDRLGLKVQVVNPGFVRTPLTDKNTFKMPFLMEVDAAARRIADGLDGSRFEVAFPSRFVFWLQRLRCLPYGVYFPLVRKGIRS